MWRSECSVSFCRSASRASRASETSRVACACGAPRRGAEDRIVRLRVAACQAVPAKEAGQRVHHHDVAPGGGRLQPNALPLPVELVADAQVAGCKSTSSQVRPSTSEIRRPPNRHTAMSTRSRPSAASSSRAISSSVRKRRLEAPDFGRSRDVKASAGFASSHPLRTA